MLAAHLPGFVLRSLVASLRGEKLTHALTVSTICVSLSLVGGVYLLQQNLVRWAEGWASDVAVAIFVGNDISEAERKQLAADLKDRVRLHDIVWTAPDAAATELARSVGVDSAAGLDRFTPWIAEGKRAEHTDAAALASISEHKHVLYVDHGTLLAERLQAIARSIAVGGLAVAALLLLGSFLVVANTVGLALNARRDEVEIMDLVGTPLEWIYIAYLTEGILLGIVGAGLAIGLIQLVVAAIGPTGLSALGVPALRGFSSQDALGLMGIGGGIGAIGSAISIRRFLQR